MRELEIDLETGAGELGCGWCGERTAPWSGPRMFQGSVYACGCGARVLLAPPHDFDEAGEELLGHLDIAGEVAEPAVPVGASGMITARWYDGAASRRRLIEVLEAAGHETRSEELFLRYVSADAPDRPWTTMWAVWWRPRAPA